MDKYNWDQRERLLDRALQAGGSYAEIGRALGTSGENISLLRRRRGERSRFLAPLDEWLFRNVESEEANVNAALSGGSKFAPVCFIHPDELPAEAFDLEIDFEKYLIEDYNDPPKLASLAYEIYKSLESGTEGMTTCGAEYLQGAAMDLESAAKEVLSRPQVCLSCWTRDLPPDLKFCTACGASLKNSLRYRPP